MWSYLIFALHFILATFSTLHILMQRPKSGVALAWITLIMIFPVVGVGLYFLVGERRIGLDRTSKLKEQRSRTKILSQPILLELGLTVDWTKHPEMAQEMGKLGLSMTGTHAVQGSSFQLFSDTHKTLEQITIDINQAQHSVLMEFYIWHVGGAADEVLEALITAAQRGVVCRLLVDAIGASKWWKSKQPTRLRKAGVLLQQALPVGLFRTLIGRTDLRLHRKIVIIDGKSAWTGSMNLVDPLYFKRDSGVGEWVDTMVRLQGPVVNLLAETLIGDWVLEVNDTAQTLIDEANLTLPEKQGNTDMQVIASGPGQTSDALLQMLLALINAARKEIIITTPYLIPDDALIIALRGAAARGVRIVIVVPEKVDSFLTRHASESYFEELMDADISIYLFKSGLLHTKSITVDSSISMFGTVNFDMRSLWVNYEISLFVYDTSFASQLRSLQQQYMDESMVLDPVEWTKRPYFRQILQNGLRLAGPLL